MTSRAWIACVASIAFGACTANTPPPSPQLWTLVDLIKIAEAGGPYVDSPNPDTLIPMSAVVTPPNIPRFFSSPPYTTTATKNPAADPMLEMLPGITEGRFDPYLTIEIWTNNFGPVWYNPIYRMVQDDGTGAPLETAGKIVKLSPDVYTVAPPDRFYSPFFQIFYVLVPASDAMSEPKNPPKSTRDVLDTNYPIIQGPNGIWPIIPSNVVMNPALTPTPTGEMRGDPSTVMAPWIRTTARAEYGSASLTTNLPTYSVKPNNAYWEGEWITSLFIGLGGYQDLPGNVIQVNPVFLWVDAQPDGSLVPAKLPTVFGHAPLFSGAPIPAGIPGQLPTWFGFWELYFTIKPAGSDVFFPVVADPDDATNTDVYSGIRADRKAALPSTAVSGLPNVARYAGRLALTPSCFAEMTPAATAEAWAPDCNFLDSQAAIESSITADNIVDAETQLLCPLLLWTEPQP